MKRLAIAALVAAAVVTAAFATTAHATNECKGLQVCVPVTGPWVLAPSSTQTQWDLTCPKGYIVAGLDAELTSRDVDVGFVGSLGSPVNPGITTSRDAVFLGRLVRGSSAAAAFRPYIGCIPASGGGQRVPTVYAPGKPTDRRVFEVPARPSRTVRERCPARERLSSATHAIGFGEPPSAAAARAVHVAQSIRGDTVLVRIRAASTAIVQIDLLCTAR